MVTWSQHLKTYDKCLKPSAKVVIAGKSWSSKKAVITNIEVSLSVGPDASTCSVDFKTTFSDFKKGKMFVDGDFAKIKLGEKIEISLGYITSGILGLSKSPKLEKVFLGYVSDIETIAVEKKKLVIRVRGMDGKVWMMPGKITELKKDDKNVTSLVMGVMDEFGKYFNGGSIKISNDPIFEKPIWQMNESYYEFMCRLAELSGCFFYVSLGKLYFTSISEAGSNGVSISPDIGVHSVSVRNGIFGQLKEVKYLSLDPKNFEKKIEAKVTSSDITKYGDSMAKKPSSAISNFGDVCASHLIDCSISSEKEAKFRAIALYNKRAVDFSQSKLLLAGIPDIEVASKLKISDYGEPVDNTYIITKIYHHYDVSNSRYETEITAGSNKIAPVKNPLFPI